MSGSEYLRSPCRGDLEDCRVSCWILLYFFSFAEKTQLLLMVAFIIVSLCNRYFNSKDHGILRPVHMERLLFFLISAVSVWLLVTFVFVFTLSRVSDRIKSWNLLIVVISILSAIFLLVSSSLLINEVTHLLNYPTPLGKIDLCKAMKHAGKQTCGHLQIASVCGFSTMLLLIGDGVLYYFKLTNRETR